MGLRWGAVVALVLMVNACGAAPPPAPRPTPPPVVAPARPAPSPAEVTYPVAVRVLHLHRVRPRAATTIWYPKVPGRFPLVLLSHGLSGSPDRYAATLAVWAAAGFVVGAPCFPHTSEFAEHFKRSDIVNRRTTSGTCSTGCGGST